MSEERIWYAPCPDLGGMLLGGDNTRHAFRIHHESFDICCCLRGDMNWRYRRRTGIMHDGSILTAEPGEIHDTPTIRRPGSIRVLMLPLELVNTIARDLGYPGEPHLSVACTPNPDVFAAFAALHATIGNAQAAQIERQALLCEALRLLLGRCGESRPRKEQHRDHPAIRRVKEIILDRYAENLTLTEAAMDVGLSPYHLAHVFREAVGVGIHAYLINVRVNRARELLGRGLPPALVASLAGFSDQSHLGRHFSRLVGLTPARYARQVANPPAVQD